MICERRDVKGVNTDRDTKNKYGEEILHALQGQKRKKKNLNSLQYNSGYTSKYHKEYILKILA